VGGGGGGGGGVGGFFLGGLMGWGGGAVGVGGGVGGGWWWFVFGCGGGWQRLGVVTYDRVPVSSPVSPSFSPLPTALQATQALLKFFFFSRAAEFGHFFVSFRSVEGHLEVLFTRSFFPLLAEALQNFPLSPPPPQT